MRRPQRDPDIPIVEGLPAAFWTASGLCERPRRALLAAEKLAQLGDRVGEGAIA
jgi:hypothetical protein